MSSTGPIIVGLDLNKMVKFNVHQSRKVPNVLEDFNMIEGCNVIFWLKISLLSLNCIFRSTHLLHKLLCPKEIFSCKSLFCNTLYRLHCLLNVFICLFSAFRNDKNSKHILTSPTAAVQCTCCCGLIDSWNQCQPPVFYNQYLLRLHN